MRCDRHRTGRAGATPSAIRSLRSERQNRTSHPFVTISTIYGQTRAIFFDSNFDLQIHRKSDEIWMPNFDRFCLHFRIFFRDKTEIGTTLQRQKTPTALGDACTLRSGSFDTSGHTGKKFAFILHTPKGRITHEHPHKNRKIENRKMQKIQKSKIQNLKNVQIRKAPEPSVLSNGLGGRTHGSRRAPARDVTVKGATRQVGQIARMTCAAAIR